MEAEVAKADHVAHGREYLDEDELLNVTPGMLAASRSMANSGANVADEFLAQGGAGMEAPSDRAHYAEREALFKAKLAQGGLERSGLRQEEYDKLLVEVDAEMLARSSRRPAHEAGSHLRRSTRHRNPSSASLMSAAYQGEQQPSKRQKSQPRRSR